MISVTSLSDYLYCKRKLYLQSVLEFKEPPKEVMVLGYIRHEVHDKINKSEESIIKSLKKRHSLDSLREIYKREHSRLLRNTILCNKNSLKQVNLSVLDVFKKAWPVILDEGETRAQNIFKFIEKNDIYGDELWEALFPKIQSEFRISSERLQLKGIIDQIEIYKDGYVPVEIKTGKCPKEGVWPGHKVQIGAYALLIEDSLKKEVKEGFVNYIELKERRHISINPFLKEEILDIRDKVIAMKKAKALPEFCGNELKCSACGLKDYCYDEKSLLEKLQILT